MPTKVHVLTFPNKSFEEVKETIESSYSCMRCGKKMLMIKINFQSI